MAEDVKQPDPSDAAMAAARRICKWFRFNFNLQVEPRESDIKAVARIIDRHFETTRKFYTEYIDRLEHDLEKAEAEIDKLENQLEEYDERTP